MFFEHFYRLFTIVFSLPLSKTDIATTTGEEGGARKWLFNHGRREIANDYFEELLCELT